MSKLIIQKRNCTAYLANSAGEIFGSDIPWSDGKRMLEEKPYLPFIHLGTVENFLQDHASFIPALVEFGDNGFIFAEIVDWKNDQGMSSRGFAVDGSFIIPDGFEREKFFLSLLNFLSDLLSVESRRSGLSGEEKILEEAHQRQAGYDVVLRAATDFGYPMFCRVGVEFVKVGYFPTDYVRPVTQMLRLCWKKPLSEYLPDR